MNEKHLERLAKRLRDIADEIDQILNEGKVDVTVKTIKSEVRELGFNPSYEGFDYLVEAILVQYEERPKTLQELSEEVGARYGVKARNVHQSIISLFDALTMEQKEAIEEKYGAATPRKFIRNYVAKN